MKSSLRKLRGFALHRRENKQQADPLAHQDEVLQAAQDMLDMRNCYDSLLGAAAATANSAYEFSEALREMGTCLLEKIALDNDEETGRVLLMLGKAQFELQKLIDSYRMHVIQTITTPSLSLVKELQTVEEMKRQCDDKRDLYKFMLAAHDDKGKSKHTKGDTFSADKLKQTQEEYQQESTLFVFRLKSLKQGQFRSLLTQAARHHAAQINFFRKGVKTLEVVEPHVKSVSERQHIDYHFSGLEDDYDAEDDRYDGYDDSDEGELCFDYGQNNQAQDDGSQNRNLMDMDCSDRRSGFTSATDRKQDLVDQIQADSSFPSKGSRFVSQSAPISADKKLDLPDRPRETQPLCAKKVHTYVLPTPGDIRSSSLSHSSNPTPYEIEGRDSPPLQIWHSSPLQPNIPLRNSVDNELIDPSRVPEAQKVPGQIRMPLPLNEESIISTSTSQSDPKKIKRDSATGVTWSGDLTNTDPIKYRVAASQSYVARRVISPTTSPPPVTSPKINELYVLPRPPISSTKSGRLPSLIPHSAPLVARGKEQHPQSTQRPSSTSFTPSPLPPPPGVMARSFSIPSSTQRGTALSVQISELHNKSSSMDISPPLLTLTNSAASSTPQTIIQAPKIQVKI